LFYTAQVIILYPTDTVYGLAVDATDVEEIRLLRSLKGGTTAMDKKYLVAVDGLDMVKSIAKVTSLAEKLAEHFWPGALSLVLESTLFPEELTCGTGTVAVRMPNHPVALALVKEFGKPITSTSANITGMPTLSTPAEILKQFGERASMVGRVIDVGMLPSSQPSTIVDARGEVPICIREGAIRKEVLFATLGL